MEFEDVADELFAVRREDFTALRDERAKQARPDRELARRIGELRKPTVAAWLVNQVSRGFPEEIDELAELGSALRRAHEQLRGEELRRLSRERHEVVDRLGKRAQWLARKEAYPFSDTASRQIVDTFEAAVSDEQALEAVRAARLSAALTPGSPEQWLTAAVLPATGRRLGRGDSGRGGSGRGDSGGEGSGRGDAARGGGNAARGGGETRRQAEQDTKTRHTKQDTKARREAEQDTKARRQAEREAKARKEAQAKARREADEAAKAQADAEQTLAYAEQAADEAAEAVADLQARLAEAKQEERARKADVTAARKELTAARRTATAAEKRASELH